MRQVKTKAWRNALKGPGIEDFRRHDLRHTFVTWRREAGTPTHELRKRAGWRTRALLERMRTSPGRVGLHCGAHGARVGGYASAT